jgi:hypothetical protein
MGVSGQLHAPATLPPMERALTTHRTGGLLDLRANLNAIEKIKILPLLGIEPWPSSLGLIAILSEVSGLHNK